MANYNLTQTGDEVQAYIDSIPVIDVTGTLNGSAISFSSNPYSQIAANYAADCSSIIRLTVGTAVYLLRVTQYDGTNYTAAEMSGAHNVVATIGSASASATIDAGIDATPTQGSDNLITSGAVAELKQEVDYMDEELLSGVQVFNNVEIVSGGKITFDAITLHENGDQLEVIALPVSTITSVTSGGYPFTFSTNENSSIRLGLAITQCYIRANDGTWLYQGGTGDNTTTNPKKIKIIYTNGNIEIYGNDVLKKTYTGQKDISIFGIGSQTMTNYGKWAGTIWKFAYTHNGVTTDLIDLPGFSKNENVTINYDVGEGRVPVLEERVDNIQAAIDNMVDYPNFIVISESARVCVYSKIHDNIYVWFNIAHVENLSDTNYTNYWRITSTPNVQDTAGFAKLENGAFVDTGERALSIAENEFAIQFYQNDFTGGVHGNERIDIDASCYVVFIVDGKEYTISELVALGTIACATFEYRERSVLYSMYSVTSTHDAIAYHVKRTIFTVGGYITKNYVEMLAALNCKTAYSGLVCVHKNCSEVVIDNAGELFTLTHPSTTAQVTGFSNKTSSIVKMYNSGLSCVLSSRVVGGNVSAYTDLAKPIILIYDRTADGKYYAMMPYNTALSIGSVFEFECVAQWNYKEQ